MFSACDAKAPSNGEHAVRKYPFLIAVSVLLLDRLSKWLIAVNLDLYDSRPVLPGLFQLTHVQNSGAAFGLFDGSSSPWKVAVLILFSVLALLVVAAMLWKNNHGEMTTGVGLALVLGGAIGNLWDRLLSGQVVDFLDFYVGTYHWPEFNFADSAIVVGAFLVASKILFAKHPADQNVPGARINQARGGADTYVSRQ